MQIFSTKVIEFFNDIFYRKKYKHYKNNLIYCLVKEVKIQQEGIWVDFVLYKRKGEYFLRNKEEFYEKFKKI